MNIKKRICCGLVSQLSVSSRLGSAFLVEIFKPFFYIKKFCVIFPSIKHAQLSL